MNRKQLIIGGLIILLIVILALGVTISIVLLDGDDSPNVTGQRMTVVSELSYCGDDDVRPCVVSFGVDENDNMLVNLLLSDLTYSRFYLKITYNEIENIYKCVRVRASLYSIYCTGEKMPPGVPLHLMLIAEEGDILLAEGELSIIGLALPAVDIVSATPGNTATPLTETPEEDITETPDFVLPTSTPVSTIATPTPRRPSYPNPSSTPSYPNPLYP